MYIVLMIEKTVLYFNHTNFASFKAIFQTKFKFIEYFVYHRTASDYEQTININNISIQELYLFLRALIFKNQYHFSMLYGSQLVKIHVDETLIIRRNKCIGIIFLTSFKLLMLSIF